MSSPILGSRERAKVKERLADLERHFVNLRQDLLTDLKSHIGPEQIQCSTKKSKDSAIQDHNGVL